MKPNDLSQFTLSSETTDEKEKQIIFTPSEIHDEDKKPFIRYFTSNPLWIGVYTILIFVAVVSGIYLFRTGTGLGQDENTILPRETPVQEKPITPDPTEEPVDISLFSVTILNGSGIAGEAGRIKTLLEDGGFTVSKTGNADRYDYEETIVYTNKDIPKQVTEKLQKLIGEFSVVTDELYDGEDATIVVIVGQK